MSGWHSGLSRHRSAHARSALVPILLLLIAMLLLASGCSAAPPAATEPTPTAPIALTPDPATPTETTAPTAPPTLSATREPAAPTATAAATPTRAPERPAPTPLPGCLPTAPAAVTGGEYVSALAANTERAWALVYTPALSRTTVYISDDSGMTWSGGRFINDFVSGLVASPVYTRDRSVFAVGAGGVYRSFNGGLSWGSITPSTWYTSTPIVRHFALSPNFGVDRLMLLGSPEAPRGIYASTDGGSTWRDWLVDAVEALFISPNYSIDRAVWAARNDEQTFRRDVMVSTTLGESWDFVRSGSAIPLAISPAYSLDSTILWGDLRGGIYLSRNSDRLNPTINKAAADALAIWKQAAGQGWSISGERAVQEVRFSADFARDRTAYAVAGNTLLVTTDGGVRWNGLCAWSANAEAGDALRFDRLALTPDGTLLVGGAGGRIAISRDRGRSFALTTLK